MSSRMHTNGGSNGNTNNGGNNGNTNYGGGIEAERAKATLWYREDIAPGLSSEMELRGILASTASEYQKIEVLETYFGRMLVTDGKTQSTLFDEFVYHESLVHPAMLKVASTGAFAKSVFIGGGGELATAREVLRHKHVQRVVMVDVDEKVIDVCKKHLPEWGGDAVLSDPRFELIIGDAHEYLLGTKEMFDVCIMDISDPIEAGPGTMLYTKEFYDYVETILNKPHGVFVTQAGMAESVPKALITENEVDPSCYAPIYNTLRASFQCVVPYSVNIPSYGSDWGLIMAFYSDDDSSGDNNISSLEESWKTPAKGLIDQLVEENILGGSDALKHYDGMSHLSSFALTKPLRQYMAKDKRIMTKDNPIFMF